MPLKIPSEDLINDLGKQALTGTAEERASALKNLERINKQLTKAANQALTRLEKAGFKRYAYTRATSYTETVTGGKRFTTSKQYLEDVGDLVENIRYARKFLNSKSHTVRGNKIIDKEILDAFRAKGMKIPDNKADEFFDFLNSDEWETLKRDFVGSEQIVENMIEASNIEGQNLEDIFAELMNLVDNKDDTTYDIALEKLGVKL